MRLKPLPSIISIALLLAVPIGCSPKATSAGELQQSPVRISSQQAEELANEYFEKKFGGCGGLSAPIDKGAYWEFTTKIGYAATPGPNISVNQATGEVASAPEFLQRIQ